MWHKHIMVFWFQNTVNPLQVRNWNSEHVCPLVFRGLNYNCIRPHAVLCWVAQLCLTLCDPMDCSPPGSSVHGILQARILEWVAMPSSRGSSQPRDRTQVSHIAGRLFTSWAIREAQENGWVACPFSSSFSQPRNRTGVSCIAGRFFTSWAIREAKNIGVGSLSLLQ